MQHFLKAVYKELKENIGDYTILILGGFFFLIFLQMYMGQRERTLIVTTFFIIFYIVWAMFHHARTQTLHIRNVLEYVLVGGIMLAFCALVLGGK